MKIEQILDIAAKKAGGVRADFRRDDIKKAFPRGALYKRAVTLVLFRLGFSSEEIMMHINYTPRSLKSAYRWWGEAPIADAAKGLLAEIEKQKEAPKPVPENPRAPRPMGDFGVYYQRRSASGGSSFHLMTRQEAGR